MQQSVRKYKGKNMDQAQSSASKLDAVKQKFRCIQSGRLCKAELIA